MFDKIKEMQVEKKLKFCFSLAVAVASIAGVLGVIFLLRNNFGYKNALVNNGFAQGEIGLFSTYLNKEPAVVREIILIEDEAGIKEAQQELDEIQAKTDAALVTMKQHCQTDAEMQYVNQIDEILPQYRSIFKEVETLASQNQNAEALDLLLTQGKPTLKKLTTAVEELFELNVEMGDSAATSMAIQTYILAGVMAAVILAAVLISMKFAAFVANIISEPISHVKEASKKLSQGDLNIQIERMYGDEVGEMTDYFKSAINGLKNYIRELDRVLGQIASGNFDVEAEVEFKGDFKALDEAIQTITASLSETMGKINDGSNEVALGASQMAESAQALAEGATDQAASVQELTATIQNVTEGKAHVLPALKYPVLK